MAVLKQSFEFPDQKIVDVNMQKQVEKSFIEYSMSVIVARALPDVRDGLKPGQRRVLYAMYEDHLTHDKPFRKSATTVGNVLGRYHPHGDASVYGTMVRMAQSFSLRYPLVEGHGNFGSVDGDPPAAYRYTEARLAKISEEMMRDIEKNVVKFVPNFDNRLREPSVLPSRIPNLLVNGSVGIAVGMATNIPPHNLGEVIDATLYRMDHPDCTVEELMQYVKGPDFPTKGIIYGNAGILQAYRTGMGRMMVRARAEVNEEKHQITVREIPYSVNKSLLVQAMAQLVKDKKVEGIRDIRDLSSDREGGIRILIDCRQDANCQVILNQLYKYTQLQDTFAINMLALVNNEPKVLSLPQILDLYLAHQEEVITNRTRFDLEKAKARAHILEGYTVAIDNIDEVVHIMKHASSIPDAKETLMSRFGLTDVQAQAIVEMTLGRLTGMERQKVEEELAKLLALIEDLEDVLRSPERVKEIIREEMTEIARKYGDARRTEIVEAEEEIDLEDLIPRHTCVITMSHQGYVKRQPADTYEAQNRGGRGKLGMTTKEEDFVEDVLVASSHDYLMFFTNMGKVYTKKVYRIPEASRTAKGSNVVNILDKLAEGEFVTSMISVSGFSDEEYLTMVTEKGVIKRTQLSDFEEKRKGGKIAIALDEEDHLLFVRHTKGDSHLIVATRGGRAIRFAEDDVRCMGRQARGVRGIRMAEGDVVVGVTVVDDEKWLLTVTENGLGKLSAFEEFTAHNRGGQGVRCHDITEKTGLLAAIATVSEDDDIMIITSQGTLIRTGVESIRKCGRTSQGVIVMRVEEGDRVMTFARLEKAEEIQSEAEAAGERNAEAEAEAKNEEKLKEEARIPNPEDMVSDDFAEE